MRYSYTVKEKGTDKEEIMEAMSLKKLKAKLDYKKQYHVEYTNKKGNFISTEIRGKEPK
tara:strand:+ start:591 stop:767 length:177 start_codon:yes stop_codon:yes gene_type:complete